MKSSAKVAMSVIGTILRLSYVYSPHTANVLYSLVQSCYRVLDHMILTQNTLPQEAKVSVYEWEGISPGLPVQLCETSFRCKRKRR